MAKEGTDDLFGFAELTGDFVPQPQSQTKDNNNKGTFTKKPPDTDSIKDESDASQLKSVLKGNGVSDSNSKEEQNKKRRISFNDYLSRVKKGDNTKTNEDQKQAKVPFTLRDENKTISETKAESRPENVKSPEIVIDENMYETKLASENWHSFSNIKKPQERAPALKKLERSNSAKKSGSIMPSFMPLPVADDDSVHELDLYDKGKTDSKRFVTMPLTKNSDILTLENTLDRKGSQSVVAESKPSPEPEEQDDVLDVFDSLFSLGETVLNLNKSLPKASVEATTQEEGSSISALDTAKQSEGKPASESSSHSDSVPSKSSQGKSKNHTADVIDLTDEPERYHRTFFLEQSQWILQSGGVENITTESSGEPKGIQEEHSASFSDPGYYFGKMGSFSGSYLSRFRYNITVFEEQCKNLGNKIVVVKEASPVKSIPVAREVNPVEIVGKTDTFPAVDNDHKESSFEQDSIEVTETGNEDYMDDDYADMLAAAQMALMEEAQNQNVAQIDSEDNSRNVETLSDKTDEGENKIEEVEVAENDSLKNKTETSTGEAVEILNSLVKTLSADIETYTSDTESTEHIEETLNGDNERFTTKTSNVEESVNEACISEKHVDEFIDSVSKLAEEVLVTTKETIPEIQHGHKNEETKSVLNDETFEIDKANSEKVDIEDSVKPAEIQLHDIVKANPVESRPILLESPEKPDSELEKKENEEAKNILPESELSSPQNLQPSDETTNTSTGKNTSLISRLDVIGATEISKVETNVTDDSNKATHLSKSDNISIDNKENKISSIEKEETVESSSKSMPSIGDTKGHKDEIINTDVSELIEKEISAKDIDGHKLNLEENKQEITEIISTEIDIEEKRINDRVDLEDKVTSDDVNGLKHTETDISTSENEKSFIISDSIIASENGERFDLARSKTIEEKKPSEKPDDENLEKEEIQETEKTGDKPSYTQQSSLVSMDYDAISDGSFSEGETRKSDGRKSVSKAKSSDRETNRKNKSVSKDSDDRFFYRSSRDSIDTSEKLANTKDKGRRRPAEDEPHSTSRTTEEMGRERSDSWDAANYRVDHKKKGKKEKSRQAVYDSESDDHVKREKKKKKSQASKKYREFPEILDDDLPKESKKFRKGKEFVEDNDFQYHTTYRKGKTFVEDDDYYKGNRKNRTSRNRTDSFDDMKNKIYEDYENVKRKDRTKTDSSKDRKHRDYSEERNKKDSFNARDYRVDKHRKKDKKKKEMLQSDADEYNDEKETMLKNKESRKYADFNNKNYNIDHETKQKKGRTSAKIMESDDEYCKKDKQKIKNRENKNVSIDRRSRSYEDGEPEYKEKRKSNKILQDTGSPRLEQNTEKRKERRDNKPTEDRDSRQSAEEKDSEFENKTLDTGKGHKSMQKGVKEEFSERSVKITGKSTEMKESTPEKRLKEVDRDGKTVEADEGVERKRMNDKVGESGKLTEVGKPDGIMSIDSGKNVKQKNKDIGVVQSDGDDYYEKKKEKKKDRESRKHSEDKIKASAEPTVSEDENSEKKKKKGKNLADSENRDYYEKERKKEKGRENSKTSEDRERSYSIDATALEYRIESRKTIQTASDEEYSENKKEKRKRKSDSKNKDMIENREERKTSIDVIDDDEYRARKPKHQKGREYESTPENQKRKSDLKETETLLYKESSRDSEDLDYEDIEHYEKEKNFQKHKEHKKSKKSRDLKDFEYETKEETVRKNKADLNSEDNYYESKRLKKKEKMKDKVEKFSRNKEISESDEEYEIKKTKKKEKIRDREVKLSKHREISDSEEEEYQRKHKKKKEKQKAHADRERIEVAEDSDTELKPVKKKDRKSSKYSGSDDEYYETKKVKDKHAKGTKHRESKYYEDDESETEISKHRKNKKSVVDEVYETEKERKKDRKRLKSLERKDYDFMIVEKDKRKHRKRRESSENEDIDYLSEKIRKKDRKHKELEMEDYEVFESVNGKKKDKKKRYTVESDEEREFKNKDKKKRKVSIDDDADDYRKEKKKKKEKKRRKSTDSEDLQYYEEKKGKMKVKKHKKSSERTDDFEDHKNEKKKHRKRHHSEVSIEEFSPEDHYSSKKEKMISSAVKISKTDRYDKDNTNLADSGATVDVYNREDYRSGKDKHRSERDFDKYDQGRLERGDLRHTLKSKKVSR